MNTGYSAGMRKHRITILNRKKAKTSDYGIDGTGIKWEECGNVWAAVDWAKGMRSLNAGAIDAYGVVFVRTNFCCMLDMRSRIKHDGQVYQILPETFHANRQANTIQFTAQMVVGD